MGLVSSSLFPVPETSYTASPHWIWLTTAESEVIPAFFIDRGAKYTLLFSHGNAEDLGHVIGRTTKLSRALNVNVFVYDYTGYGLSTGVAHEEATYADVQAAFQYLRSVMGIPWEHIVLYGWSLGSGPSVHLASRTPVAGLVLHSAFTSIGRLVLPTTASLPGDVYPNLENIGGVLCPVYIVHGVEDDVTPVWHAHELAGAVRKASAFPPLLVEGAGHTDVDLVAGEDFVEGFQKFLASLELRGARLPREAAALAAIPE
mmetsp:Transcript_70289/g.197062  ORF Transcript_70289/g.197062 Transcript_70289/m.197062 type:complete len:259 (+) Transcript_70289:157-933(+)